jgi:hypothetical protein
MKTDALFKTTSFTRDEYLHEREKIIFISMCVQLELMGRQKCFHVLSIENEEL